jgi:hypothetical protein
MCSGRFGSKGFASGIDEHDYGAARFDPLKRALGQTRAQIHAKRIVSQP